jgi:hypothetical protein
MKEFKVWTRKTGCMDDGLLINMDLFLWLSKQRNFLFNIAFWPHFHFELIKKIDSTNSPPKKNPFTFDGHDTAFSCWKDGGHDCRKPDPVGAAEALLNFFSAKWTKILDFFGFWRVSRHPHPRAQFSKSRQASANRGPAYGLRPPPSGLWMPPGLA